MSEQNASEIVEKILKNNFSERVLTAGRNSFHRSTIIDPWNRGDFDTYLILSAVVSENSNYQVRLKYKGENCELTSKCNCSSWNEDEHCSHVVALMLFYQDLLRKRESLSREDGGASANSTVGMFKSGYGVYPERFGTIIKGAAQLKGANPRSVYSSVQYKLINGNVVSFPIVEQWEGKLVLNIREVDYTEDGSGTRFYQVQFIHMDDNAHINMNISIFEYLYLFDWNSGRCLELPNEIKDYVRKLLACENILPLNDHLRISQKLCSNGLTEIYFNDRDIREFPVEQVGFRISIEKGIKRNSLRMIFETHDSENNLLPMPSVFLFMAFENGLLSSFARKGSAYEFLEKYALSLEENIWNYKNFLRLSSEKEYIQELIDYLADNNEMRFIHEGTQKLYVFDSLCVKLLIQSMFKAFRDQFLRFAFYDKSNRQLIFDMPKRVLLDGVFELYSRIKVLGIPVYYNKSEIRPWNSQVRFERKSNQNEWFDLDLNISPDDLEIIRNADLASNISMSSNGLVLLDPDKKNLLKMLKRYTTDAEVSYSMEGDVVKYSLPLKRARIFELFELRRLGVDGALSPEDIELCERLSNLKSTPEYQAPSIYNGIARSYQLTGYNWLRFLYENKFGACLADDMGLGKTLQAIMFLESIIDQIDKVLIVCPVSIIINWEKEFLKFSTLKPSIYYSGSREFDPNAKIIITSYGIMKREFAEQFKDEKFDILIMDEVQHLKNIRSMGAIAARKLNVGFRMCLTGTPVENDLAEFYNILDLCIPGVWGDIRYIRSSSNKKSRLLAKRTVKPFILRRNKEQVLSELPPKEDNVIVLNFDKDENEKYLSSLVRIRNQITQSMPQKKYGAVLKGLLELRQLCLWQRHHHGMASTKINYLIESLEQILEEGHQVIVFSQFTAYLDLIQKEIESRRWRYSRIDGKKSYRKRQEEVDKFQNGERQIFLISLRAGGVGLNLTAASYIFLMDPWWNPAVESQAIDRAHRIGQENKLIVYRPVIKNSVEEKVLLLQERKKELFNDLMGSENDEFFTGKLSMKDFEEIIGD